MKKLMIALLGTIMLSGCVATPKPFCTGFVKTYGASGEAYYSLRVQEARIKGNRFPEVQLRTKYGWWNISHFDLKYGDCKIKLEQSKFM